MDKLVKGGMYCCMILDFDGQPQYGDLVRYCGKDASGRELFADADTWEEVSPDYDELVEQLGLPIDPTTKGWPELAE